MPSRTNSSGEGTTDSTYPKGENPAVERVAQIKDQASDLARAAVDRMEGSRSTTAEGLASAASTLHGQADRLPGGEKITGIAHTAADRLSTTADYVRTHDLDQMLTHVKRLVKNNPGPSLLVAAAFGFLVGEQSPAIDARQVSAYPGVETSRSAHPAIRRRRRIAGPWRLSPRIGGPRRRGPTDHDARAPSRPGRLADVGADGVPSSRVAHQRVGVTILLRRACAHDHRRSRVRGRGDVDADRNAGGHPRRSPGHPPEAAPPGHLLLPKPRDRGPFPAVVLSHGAGGSAQSYGRELGAVMRKWGLVCIATNYTHARGVPIGTPGP